MKTATSLVNRFILAILLMVGFYLLALSIAAGLLWTSYAVQTYMHRFDLDILISCVGGAGVILWSIIPRPDRFLPPGPQLTRQAQPELHQGVEQIAQSAGQPPPAEIYLIPEVNAWVSHRGGWMGIGSRRVMAVGLPLMQALTLSQFRGVLAHEFGHFCGGDTTLGPWIYKTRSALGRTVWALYKRRPWLSIPFLWYGKAFLRITHAISRQQEYFADQLAAQVVGPTAVSEALKRLHGIDLAYRAFWNTEMAPALKQGYRPPFSYGFALFLDAAQTAEQMNAAVQEELQRNEFDLYDTHPCLADRLAALKEWPPGSAESPDPLAITILRDLNQCEEDLLRSVLGSEKEFNALKTVDWEDVQEKVWVPTWQKLIRDYGISLSRLIPASLGDYAGAGKSLAVRLRLAATEGHTMETHERQAIEIIGCALCLLLYQNGWTIESQPGAAIVFKKEDLRFLPFDASRQLIEGKMSIQQWRAECDLAGISNQPLTNQSSEDRHLRNSIKSSKS